MRWILFHIGCCWLCAVTPRVAAGAGGDPCTPPDCVSPSVCPPGGLAPTNTPQMVLLTFDDGINTNSYETVRGIVGGLVNPNGTPIQATFFAVSSANGSTDFWYAQRAFAEGHEVAMHTMTHTTGSNTPPDVWRREIVGCRKTFAWYSGIPEAEIAGFRAPELAYNNGSFQILQEAGFGYDSSITEIPGRLSSNAATLIWPYTLDNGVAQDCWTGIRPTNNFPGLFEVPLWTLFQTGGNPGDAMDPSGTDEEVWAKLQYTFWQHYYGNRAPMGLFLHADIWKARQHVIRQFIQWAQTFPDVWFVKVRSAVAFMRRPVNLAGAYAFAPFITRTNTYCAWETARACNFPGQGYFHVCGDCPPLYPMTDNLYYRYVAATGGVGRVTLTPWTTTFNGELAVSNNLGVPVPIWEAALLVEGGQINNMWNGDYRYYTNDIYLVRPKAYMQPLMPGKVDQPGFGGPKTGPSLRITLLALQFFGVGPLEPQITSVRPLSSNRYAVGWTDAAFGYDLMQRTSLTAGAWMPASNPVWSATGWTGSCPQVKAGFLRIQTRP